MMASIWLNLAVLETVSDSSSKRKSSLNSNRPLAIKKRGLETDSGR